MKIKPILPSLREKKRYLVFEIISESQIRHAKQIWDSFKANIQSFLGELGSSKAGIIFLEDKYDPKKQKGILRTNHKHVDLVKSALITIKDISGNPVIIRIIGVSGILKKAQEKFVEKT